MSVNPEYIGRVYPPTEPYEVGREKIREFAEAINDWNPVYRDAEAARALGHPDVIAPPTFGIILTLRAAGQVIVDPDFNIDYSRVVHGEQRFEHVRPITAGDVLRVVVTVEDILAQLAANSALLAALTREGVAVWPAQVTTTIVLTFVNYLVYRWWVFR